MSGPEKSDLTQGQRRARDAVRGLPRPAADAAFRERLKQGFASGALTEREPGVREKPIRRLPLRLGLVAAAATVLLVVGTFLANPRPGPVPVRTSGVGVVTVDGRAVDASRIEEIAGLLHPGAVVSVADGAELDIDYAGTMSWRLYPGTTMTLPAAPGRWFGREVSATVDVGEALVLTRDGFPGARLAVSTDEGTVTITGTLVSIVRNEEVTCVCVQEGTARMAAGGKDLGPILPGRRWVLFRDGRDPFESEYAPPHRDHMLEFKNRAR